MEHEKLAKSHRILLYVMEFYQFSSQMVHNFLESPHFPIFFTKCHKCKIDKRDGLGKLRNGHVKVMDKCFVKSVGTLT